MRIVRTLGRKRLRIRAGVLSATLFLWCAPAWASRTGLNNIPIAAVSEPGSGVIQAYSAFGEGRKPTMLTGARIGFLAAQERFEAGADSRWKPGTSVPAFLNAKWASHWDRALPALGIGVASAALRSEDRDRLGQSQSYAVLSYQTSFARIHGGYAVQTHNNALFFGLDRSWTVAHRPLMFRSDILEIQDRAQWLGSVGFTYKLSGPVGMELWDNIPMKRGKAYLTIKFGWAFKY